MRYPVKVLNGLQLECEPIRIARAERDVGVMHDYVEDYKLYWPGTDREVPKSMYGRLSFYDEETINETVLEHNS